MIYFTSDAERGLSIRCCSSEPVFQDGQGHKFLKFWRLSGYFGETDVQLQDIEVRDSVAAKERWYTYSTEQKAMVEKHISSFRYPNKAIYFTFQAFLRNFIIFHLFCWMKMK
ncbi:uncharacterized protein LOC120200879 [Hibiscus syriacus]|uniref:uncharacterized protein LOC120200879 n=1 Tax=Hibiscus syriacus TaxID=106335 RepID=UPI001920B55D|nr:uncharacterized protein LOC120200879 [Hibiscus syriacus]